MDHKGLPDLELFVASVCTPSGPVAIKDLVYSTLCKLVLLSMSLLLYAVNPSWSHNY